MNLAFYLILAGVIVLAAVFFLIRQRRRADAGQHAAPPVPVNLASTTDAILFASGYGRVTFANHHARHWFGLNGGDPDLELLSEMVNPPDVFRDLFATEGRATFQVGQRRVDASSHYLPGDAPTRHMVVVLRDMAVSQTEYGPGTTRALVTLNQIGQRIATNDPLPEMLEGILSGLLEAIPHEAGQIYLWQPEFTRLRLLADQGSVDYLSLLEQQAQIAPDGEGYTGWVTIYMQPLLVEDCQNNPNIRMPDGGGNSFRSYIGSPMTIGDQFIGVVQLVAQEPAAFDYEDLALLEAVANQMATAVDKARLYDEKIARANELAGVQAVVQAAATVSDRQGLYRQLTQHIAAAMDMQVCGLLLYDPVDNRLIPQRPFLGIPDTVLNAYQFNVPETSIAHRVWQRDEGWYANDLRDETLLDEIGLATFCEPLGLRNMALIPMIVGKRRIGMVQVNNRRNLEDIGPQELQRLRMFATQAAIVLESMTLAERDHRRSAEVRTLQEIGLSVSRARDYSSSYAASAAQIAALLGAEMAGVMLYDVRREALLVDETFYGVDPGLLEYIQIPVLPGTSMERLWREGEYWLCNDLSRDLLAAEIGLDQLTSWVGISQVLLVPLLVSGVAVGAILVTNKQGHLGFGEDDAQLVNIYAAQVALTLENSRLQTEIQAHVTEARMLRQVSAIVSQTGSFDALIQNTLRAVAQYFNSAIAYVDLLDESSGELKIMPEHIHGVMLDEMIAIDAYGQGMEDSVVISGQSSMSNDLASDLQIQTTYRQIIHQLTMRSALIAPLQAGGEGIGELVVANRRGVGGYTRHDLEVLNQIALQLGAAIERLRLHGATDDSLRMRIAELDALGRVSNELSMTVELERVMEVIRHEALRVTDVAECTMLMLAPREEWGDLEQPEEMQRHGAVNVITGLAGIEKIAIGEQRVVTVVDYAASEDMVAEPPAAVSALAAPIMYGEKVVGVIHLYHAIADYFDERIETFVRSLAVKATTAYGNAARFREQISRNLLLSRRVEQLNQIFELGQVMRSEGELGGVLDAVAHAVQVSTGYSVVMLSLYNEELDGFQRVAQAGMPLATFEEIRQQVATHEQIDRLFQPQFRMSQSYFLPAEQQAEWGESVEPYLHTEYVASAISYTAWQPTDMLLVPLRDSQGELLGYMSVDAPVDGQRPVRSVLEPLEIFAQQASIAVENFHLLAVIQREADAARHERDLMERLYAVSTEIQRAADIPSRLQVVAQGIQNAGWQRVHISLRDDNMDTTTLIQAGYDPAEETELHRTLSTGMEWQARLSDPAFYETRLGTAFYLRHNNPWVVEHLRPEDAPPLADEIPDDWHPDDRIFLPIYGAENRLIGLIGMDEPVNEQMPTEASMRPIELFANQAANAIEMVRLYQETSRSAEQEALFNEMTQAVTSTLDINRIVRAIADGLQRFLPFTRITVGFYDEQNDRFDTLQASFINVERFDVMPGRPQPVEGTAMGRVFSEGRGAIYFMEVTEVREELDLEFWYSEYGEHTTMLVPMTVGGIVVGVLHLGSELSHAFGFDEETMGLVQRVANLAAVAIENARLYQQTAERERFSAALVRLSSDLNATLDLPLTLQSICRESLEILGVEGAYIWQGDHANLLGIAGVGLGAEDFVGKQVALDDADNLAVRVYRERQPRFINDVALTDEKISVALEDFFTPQAVMGVPLMREGVALGVLIVVRIKSDELFTYAGMERAAIFATQGSIAVENARLYQEMHDLQGYTGAIVESIQQGIVVMNRDGDITTFNSAMFQRYGFSFDDEGRHLFEIKPEYRAALAGHLREVVLTGQPRLSENVAGQLADGSAIIQNFYLYPLQQANEVTGIVLLVEDVTERAQLEADLASRADQLAALTDVSSRLTATLEPNDVVTLVLDQLGEVMAYDGVTLWLREEDNLRIAAARGYQGTAQELVGLVVALEDSVLFQDMAERRQIMHVPDVREDQRFPASAARPTLTWLGAPLISKGDIIGLLALDKVEASFYSPDDEQLVLAFANQAAVALENARLFEDARRRTQALTQQTERLDLLNRVSTMLAQSLDLENILEVALRESTVALELPSAQAIIFNQDLGVGRVLLRYPRGDAPPQEVIPLLENLVITQVRRALQPLIYEHAQSDSALECFHEDFVARDISSVMVAPLIVGGQAIGLLVLETTGEARRFTPEQVELVQTITGQAAIAAQNANLLEQSFLRTRELETLFEASQATSVTLDLEQVIQSVAQQMLHALSADASTVMLWNDVEQNLTVYADVNMMGPAEQVTPAGTVYELGEHPAWAEALRERIALLIRQDDELHPDEGLAMAAVDSQTRLLVPLVVRDTSIGLIRIELYNPHRSFGQSEQRIARTLAGQAAIAIENARLNSETQAQMQEAFLINDLSRMVSAAVDMQELLPIVRNQLPALTSSEWLYLAVYDRAADRLEFPVALHLGEDVELAPRALGDDEFSSIIRSSRALLLVGDEQDYVRSNLTIQSAVPDLASFLGVPLSVGTETVGVLAVGDDDDVRAFSQNDQRILSTVAGQLAVAVQNATLFAELRSFNQELEERVRVRTEEVRSERDRLDVLYNITAEMSATLDMDRVLTRALELLAQAVGAEQGIILLIDHQGERLYKRAELGGDPAEAGDDGPSGGIRTNEGLAGWVLQNRQSVVIDDVQRDPRWLNVLPRHSLPRATLSVLLETSDEQLGVLMLYAYTPGVFNEDHLRMVEAAGSQLATSINNAELYLFIREQAERLGDMVREQQVEASKSTAILEGVADGVVFANEVGEITLFNQTAERVLDISRYDIIGRPISRLSGLYGGGGQRWMDAIEQWMSDPTLIKAGDYLSETLELEGKIVNVTLAPVHMSDQFLGTVSVVRDITRDVEVDRMKTEFISNVSHELRTPMTSIKGYADLLVLGAGGEITDRQREFLDTIKENADRLTTLVNDLLEISRFDSGEMTLEIRPVNLMQVGYTVMANLKGQMAVDGKAITLVDEIAEDLPGTMADTAKITQILTNLLDNAYQYTPEGGKITLSVKMNGDDQFLITVADTGIGIPTAHHSRVFDRFYRNNDHPLVIETPGTGLGLALVQEMVALHDGKIWFESQEGVGSTFYVALPYVAAPPDQTVEME